MFTSERFSRGESFVLSHHDEVVSMSGSTLTQTGLEVEVNRDDISLFVVHCYIAQFISLAHIAR